MPDQIVCLCGVSPQLSVFLSCSNCLFDVLWDPVRYNFCEFSTQELVFITILSLVINTVVQ